MGDLGRTADRIARRLGRPVIVPIGDCCRSIPTESNVLFPVAAVSTSVVIGTGSRGPRAAYLIPSALGQCLRK
jgi:hypothetical protein